MQRVKPMVPAELQIEEHQARLVGSQQASHFLPPRCRDGTHITVFEIIGDHALHHGVVIDDQNLRRLTANRAPHQDVPAQFSARIAADLTCRKSMPIVDSMGAAWNSTRGGIAEPKGARVCLFHALPDGFIVRLGKAKLC